MNMTARKLQSRPLRSKPKHEPTGERSEKPWAQINCTLLGEVERQEARNLRMTAMMASVARAPKCSAVYGGA